MTTPGGDADWVRAARAGSDAAFARLVERHQAPLRGFLRRALGAAAAEADDVAQEALLAAWTGLASLKDPHGFRPWLFGIAWRKAGDRLRGGRRRAARDGAWVEAATPGPGLAAEDRLALGEAMAALAPDERACVALCLGGGWSHGDAALALGLPLGTVKTHVSRGRSRLLAALGGCDDA